MERYLRFPGGKGKALTFSYDDGVTADIRLIKIFRKYGMKGTFNLNSGMMGTQTNHTRISAEEAKKTYTADVCEVACHTVDHPALTDDNPLYVWEQVLEDRKSLEKLFGKQIHGFAYPYGASGDTIMEILKNAGIYYARTTKATKSFDQSTDWLRMPTTCHHSNPTLMELADKFLAKNIRQNPKVFSVWGHSYEFDTPQLECDRGFLRKNGIQRGYLVCCQY